MNVMMVVTRAQIMQHALTLMQAILAYAKMVSREMETTALASRSFIANEMPNKTLKLFAQFKKPT